MPPKFHRLAVTGNALDRNEINIESSVERERHRTPNHRAKALLFKIDPLLSRRIRQAIKDRSTMIAAGKHPIHRWILHCLIGLAAVSALSGCGINAIPTYEEQMKASWSQVLDQYERRADLISALVDTVESFAVHEKDVLTSVVKARDKARQARVPREIISNPAVFQSFQESQVQVTGALARLLGIVENYPMLRSSQSFLSLQSQLDGAEKRIAAARRDYVEAVRLYNAELMTIPGRWWAAVLYPDAELAQTFAVEEKDLNAPQVNFAPGTALVLESAAPVEQQ